MTSCGQEKPNNQEDSRKTTPHRNAPMLFVQDFLNLCGRLREVPDQESPPTQRPPCEDSRSVYRRDGQALESGSSPSFPGIFPMFSDGLPARSNLLSVLCGESAQHIRAVD